MKLGEHIEIECRLGSKPELVNEMCGHKLVRFVIAVVDKRINNNKYTQQTSWHTVNALGDTAETILDSDLRICDTIHISGRWIIDDNRDALGNNNYRCEILAEDVSETSKVLTKNFNVA